MRSALIAPLATFLLGIAVQIAFGDVLGDWNPELTVLILVLLTLLVLVLMSRDTRTVADKRLAALSADLADLTRTTGLRVEYVVDQRGDESYVQATRLVEQAQESLTFVDVWIPSENYQVELGERQGRRQDFYDAITRQIERHSRDPSLFHRRLVQIPEELVGRPIPFDVDPPYRNYLLEAAAAQESSPSSCRVRVAGARVMTHFIMVDQRWIVMPILSRERGRQIRHGALFFDDREGTLAQTLRGLYSEIDARSRPLTLDLVRGDASIATPAEGAT